MAHYPRLDHKEIGEAVFYMVIDSAVELFTYEVRELAKYLGLTVYRDEI